MREDFAGGGEVGDPLGASAFLPDAQALLAGDDVRLQRGRFQKVGGVGALASAAAGAGGGDVQRRGARGAPVSAKVGERRPLDETEKNNQKKERLNWKQKTKI